jgi:hypothetical protein
MSRAVEIPSTDMRKIVIASHHFVEFKHLLCPCKNSCRTSNLKVPVLSWSSSFSKQKNCEVSAWTGLSVY